MRIIAMRRCEPRNIYCHRPVVWFELDLEEFADKETRMIPGFNERLLHCFPGLSRHHCSLGRPGGFLARLESGTLFGHLVEHLALEFQWLAGSEVVYGKTRSTARSGVYELVIECHAPGVAVKAVSGAVEAVSRLAAGEMVAAQPLVEGVARVLAEEALGPSTQSIASAAVMRGIPILPLGGSLLQLGHGRAQRRVWATLTDRTSCLGADVAGNKALAKRMLELGGIRVPRGEMARDEQDAIRIARELGLPVAVKPLNGNQGNGVSLALDSPDDIAAAFHLAKDHADRVMVEQFVSGRHYRVLVVGGRAVAVAERIPAHIVGDGRQTVRELVDATNADPRRGHGHERPLTRIRIDPVVLMTLSRQNLTLDYVPGRNEIVVLRRNANLSTGGQAADVTDLAAPQNTILAERAARIVGLDIAGVDLVADDISTPIGVNGGAVIEVNAAPGLRMHLHPSVGTPRSVGEAVVNYLFPGNRSGRIPIVAVTGTNGKTTTVRLVGRMLAGSGRTVGTSTTDGVFIGSSQVVAGDSAGPEGTRMVLCEQRVDAAVLEIARGGLVRTGIAYDQADVGVITNVGDDHVGQDGIETITELIHAKSLVAEAVRPDGAVVLCADDPAAPLIAARAGASIIYTSVVSGNPIAAAHIASGGRAVIAADGVIRLIGPTGKRDLIAIDKIPLTYQGRCEAGLANALCAAACGWSLGLDDEFIRCGLSLAPLLTGNRGRLNYVRVGDRQVLIDYGHNPPAIAAAARLGRRLAPTGALIGVIAVPGDRTDRQIVTSGEICGSLFDQLVIKEDSDLRGRRTGEIAKLLLLGVRQTAINQKRVRTILDERTAVEVAVREASPDDLVVIFYESLAEATAGIEAGCGSPCEPAQCLDLGGGMSGLVAKRTTGHDPRCPKDPADGRRPR